MKWKKRTTQMPIQQSLRALPKKTNDWLIKIILFNIIVIAFYLFAPKFPLQSSLCLLLILCNLFVGSILKLYEQRDARNNYRFDMPTALNEKQKKNAQNLLRYATAVMAFLSLTTTAQGMHGYVFKKMWLAYLGSFGVQSILVVFSLLLCRFYVTVGKCQWHDYIKKSVKLSMVLFFSLSLMVSSVFSFTYIADNAYADSWASDRESMIQTYLTNESYRLQQENERRGKILIDKIYDIINEDLSKSMETIEQDETEKTNEAVKELIDKIEIETEFLNTDVDIDPELEANLREKNDNDTDSLLKQYNKTYKTTYTDSVDIYNDAKTKINDWKSTNKPISEIAEEVETLLEKIKDTITNLAETENTIDNLRTYQINIDIQSVHGTYKTQVGKLKTSLKSLKKKLTKIQTEIENNDNTETDSVSNNLTSLIKDIYSLKITADGTKNKSNPIDDILKNISDILETITSDDSFSDDHTKALVDLKDYIEQYQKYIELQKNLKDYCDIDMKTVYNIWIKKDSDEEGTNDKNGKSSDTKSDNDKNVKTSDNKKDAPNSAPHTSTPKNSSANTKELTEKEWAEERNEDFFQFIGYLKSLPDVTAIEPENDTTKSKSANSKNTDANSSSKENFDSDKVLEETSVMQRNFLGNLTMFERAFNYFLYDYKMMVFFSAFIAVYLDLSAFLVGCFLYFTEIFKENE